MTELCKATAEPFAWCTGGGASTRIAAWRKKKNRYRTYFPTKFSSTELFPALWPPTTAICGRSRLAFWPMAEKASCMRFTRGIKSSIPRLPIFAVQSEAYAFPQSDQQMYCLLLLLFVIPSPRHPRVQRASCCELSPVSLGGPLPH